MFSSPCGADGSYMKGVKYICVLPKALKPVKSWAMRKWCGPASLETVWWFLAPKLSNPPWDQSRSRGHYYGYIICLILIFITYFHLSSQEKHGVSPHCSSQLCIVSPSLFFTQLWTTRVGNGTSLEHRCGSAAGSFFPDVPTGCELWSQAAARHTYSHGCQVKSFRYLFGEDNPLTIDITDITHL